MASRQHATAHVAEHEVAPAVHRVAAARLFHPEAALRALAQLLVLREGGEGGVGGVGVAVLGHVLLAAHAGVPRLAAADEAEGLAAHGAVELAVARVPRELEWAASSGAAVEVVGALDAPFERKTLCEARKGAV